MMSQQSFDQLKERLSIVDVIGKYIAPELLVLAADKTQIRVACPRCASTKNSLSINPGIKKFRCFRCADKSDHFQGDLIDFVAGMEKIDRPGAGKQLNKWFPLPPASAVVTAEEEKPPTVQNKPLGWALKNIEYAHPAVTALGLPDHVIADYEIGYYTGKGNLSESLIAPIRRADSELVGYIAFAMEKGVTYPSLDKFNPETDLFGLSALAWGGLYHSVLYIVQSPVDVLSCAARGMQAIATMSELPSLPQLEALALLAEDKCDICYLFSEQQGELEMGKIVKRLVSSTDFYCQFNSISKILLS